ncbi:MAG: rRNA pseudouridine synthase [Xanthomonadales bacterium]|nr:rRNA pseudouridine synthase [Xanthomonadales bacterium]
MRRGPRPGAHRKRRSAAPVGERATASHGLARVLSKRGACSRSQAEALVRAGRVSVAGRVCTDPERRTALDADDLAIDGLALAPPAPVYLALNKPRGLVTSRSDERGRDTVYACLADAGLPWLAPVGRLDRASEGLLLFSNDSAWAARVSAPGHGLHKTYHVQVDRVPDPALLDRLRAGIDDDGERLLAVSVECLRSGGRTAWLEIVLDQGRNRQIRRMLTACGVQVMRLVRVAIGPVRLGELGKGCWRLLAPAEREALASPGGAMPGAGPTAPDQPLAL